MKRKVKIKRSTDGWEVWIPNDAAFRPWKFFWFPTFEQAVRYWSRCYW
jgi:hypothetical protein